MGKSLVGLRHTMNILTFLDCVALAGGGIENLAGEAIDHGLFTT